MKAFVLARDSISDGVRRDGPGRLRKDYPPPLGDRMKRATVLDELATAALRRAQDLRSNTDLDTLYQEALLFEKRDFAGALSAPGLSVISEIKRASPSAGFIREADPAEWGARYESEGRIASPSSPSPNASREVSKTSTPRATTPLCRSCAKTSPSMRRRSSRPEPGPTPSSYSGALRRGGARPLRLPGRRGRSDAARGDPRRGRGEPGPRIGRAGSSASTTAISETSP